ncbi:MAG: 4Fe-4S binding protein [Desulfovibrio sp.]|uniref:4Fe-4S binding protein n=1 Tax=Desulfovibrio sp. TaxID=885 RepID=UPI00135E285F|nr:4Fe-4S ferredoxin [Desulfovibrio sp.]MTJ93133.1 4Fe-4S binding protein [Desulfovibrio sp.]
MSGASRLIPLPSFIMLLPAGAHFWRSGQPGLAATCLVLALLAWSRAAWVRLLLLLVLPLLAARWIWSAGQFVQMRMLMGEPWHRLAAILLTVALLTVLATWPLLRVTAQQRFHKGEGTARIQLAALFLCVGLLLPVWIMKPDLLVLERFFPQWGSLQLTLAGVWAALAAGWLSGKKSPQARMRLWRLFSMVFFAQLVLGLLLESRFLLSGQLHLPVPGLIAAAPVYRGGGWFMLGLFSFSTLLAGAAWCSHLCYFGVWDATAAKACAGGPRGLIRMAKSSDTADTEASPSARQDIPCRAPAWLPYLRLVMLALTLGIPLLLRLTGAPVEAALSCGLLLGLLALPASLLVSRKAGYPAYCRGLCPLGLLAKWLGRIAPWRVRRTGSCCHCMACVRVCRQDAMGDPATTIAPNADCNLCRDCVAVCPQKALSVTFYGLPGSQVWAGPTFVAVLAALHAAFLAMARI